MIFPFRNLNQILILLIKAHLKNLIWQYLLNLCSEDFDKAFIDFSNNTSPIRMVIRKFDLFIKILNFNDRIEIR